MIGIIVWIECQIDTGIIGITVRRWKVLANDIKKLTSVSYELKVPKTKWCLGDRAFAGVGPSLWNTLPSVISSIQSDQGFKQALKTFLFRLAFAE